MSTWLVIAGAGAGSYLFRVSMLVLAARARVPQVLERAARLAVPTAFAALATTSLAQHVRADTSALGPCAAMAAAQIAVRRTGSSSAALLAGMPTLWVVSAIW
jgi:branched-subunit amino acid transport protein